MASSPSEVGGKTRNTLDCDQSNVYSYSHLKLEQHSEQRLVKDGNHLGGSEGGSS